MGKNVPKWLGKQFEMRWNLSIKLTNYDASLSERTCFCHVIMFYIYRHITIRFTISSLETLSVIVMQLLSENRISENKYILSSSEGLIDFFLQKDVFSRECASRETFRSARPSVIRFHILVACTRLYSSLCRSVFRSVCLSVCRSVITSFFSYFFILFQLFIC